jgi:hypothetical protein
MKKLKIRHCDNEDGEDWKRDRKKKKPLFKRIKEMDEFERQFELKR